MLIDVHSHVEHKNIKAIVNSTTPETIREVLNYKYAAFGLFPLELIKLSDKEFRDTLRFIEKNASKCVALGEIGLDYSESLLPSETKKMEEGFRKFLKLAEKIKKPVIVHARAASKQVFAALENFKGKVVLHYFMGSKKLIKKGIEKGYYFGFNTRVLKLDQVRNMAEMVPINLMLLETDIPYIPSKPSDLKKVLKELEKIKGKKLEKQIWENSRKLFKI